jgi:hypothetical protein
MRYVNAQWPKFTCQDLRKGSLPKLPYGQIEVASSAD